MHPPCPPLLLHLQLHLLRLRLRLRVWVQLWVGVRLWLPVGMGVGSREKLALTWLVRREKMAAPETPWHGWIASRTSSVTSSGSERCGGSMWTSSVRARGVSAVALRLLVTAARSLFHRAVRSCTVSSASGPDDAASSSWH
jgi:hypothetical protein